MILFGFLFFLVVWILCSRDCIKPRKFPPGPPWFPLIGAFPFVHRLRKKTKYLHIAFKELSLIYGPVLGLKLGRQKIVVISGNELVKKVLLRDEFNGRPDGFFFRVRSFGKRIGVLFTDGPIWLKMRKLSTRHLRSFGFGQKFMNINLNFEAERLVLHFRKHVRKIKKPFSMTEAFNVAILNSIWSLMSGKRFPHGDPKLENIVSVVNDAFRSSDTLGGIVSHLPFLRFIIPELSGYNHLMSVLEKLWRFIGDEIDSQVENMKPDRQPKNFIQAFLKESTETCDREELVILCLDLFMAGTKTTTDSISSIFGHLLHYPHWQESIQNDLDEVVGRHNQPTLEHINHLPRVEAFLSEALRVLDLAPLGVPHKTMKDVSLEGYHIPKDTMILFNYRSALSDESCWEKPEEFHPERFLDENGKFQRKNEYILFGIGKRRCLGEIFAKSTIFLFFTHVLHNFRLEVAEEYGLPRTDGIDGFVISPRPFMVNLIERN